MGKAVIMRENTGGGGSVPADLESRLTAVENKVAGDLIVFDGLILTISPEGIPTLTYDDADGKTHTGRFGNMTLAVTIDGKVTLTQTV